MHSFVRCLVPLVLCAGCATTGAEVAPGAQTSRVVLVDTNGEPEGVSTAVPVSNSYRTSLPVDSALARLTAGYAAAHVEPSLVDPATHRVGNPRLSLRHTLAGEPLSHFVNCGMSMSANHADRDQILISVVSTVRPAPGGGSQVETLLTANAQDRTAGTVGDMLPCTTTGALEIRIHNAAFGAR